MPFNSRLIEQKLSTRQYFKICIHKIINQTDIRSMSEYINQLVKKEILQIFTKLVSIGFLITPIMWICLISCNNLISLRAVLFIPSAASTLLPNLIYWYKFFECKNSKASGLLMITFLTATITPVSLSLAL